MHAVAGRLPSLPWLVVTENSTVRRSVQASIKGYGWSVVENDCSGPWRPHMPPPAGGGVHGKLATRERPRPESETESKARQFTASTAAVLLDFFSLQAAAGIIAVTPRGEAQESSFSTIAALSRDVPLILAYPRTLHGRAVRYERDGNGGQPLRGFFWMEDNATFLRAVEARSKVKTDLGEAASWQVYRSSPADAEGEDRIADAEVLVAGLQKARSSSFPGATVGGPLKWDSLPAHVHNTP